MGLYGPSALAALFVGRLWEKLTGTEYREDPVWGKQPVSPVAMPSSQPDFRSTLADVAAQASTPAGPAKIESAAAHEDADAPPPMPF